MSNDEKKGPNLVLPLLLIGGAVAVAYATTLRNVVDAAERLRYQITRIQIYRISDPIVFRIWVQFTNLSDTDIIIQHLYADIFLNFGTVEQPNEMRVATLYPSGYIVIPANNTVEIAFDVEVRLLNLAPLAYTMLKGLIDGSNSGVKWPTSARVDGELKAENFVIPVQMSVPFNSTPIEQ